MPSTESCLDGGNNETIDHFRQIYCAMSMHIWAILQDQEAICTHHQSQKNALILFRTLKMKTFWTDTFTIIITLQPDMLEIHTLCIADKICIRLMIKRLYLYIQSSYYKRIAPQWHLPFHHSHSPIVNMAQVSLIWAEEGMVVFPIQRVQSLYFLWKMNFLTRPRAMDFIKEAEAAVVGDIDK